MELSRPTELARSDLGEVTRVHAEAFPEAFLTRIGPEVVERYYDWQLSDANEASAVGVHHGDALLGFAVGGFFRDSISGFFRANRGLILTTLLRKPWLALDKAFWSRLAITAESLRRTSAKKPQPHTPTRPLERSSKRRRYTVLSIAVDPAHQSKGIGSLLLADQEARAKALGLSEIGLSVQVANEGAVAFYLKQGWQRVDQGHGWRGKMQKSLGPAAPGQPR